MSRDVENFYQKSLDEKMFYAKEITKQVDEFKRLQKEFDFLKEKTALLSINSNTGEEFTKEEIKDILRKEHEAEDLLHFYQLESIRKKYNLMEAKDKKKILVEGPIDYAEYEIMCIEIINNIEVTKQVQEETQELGRKISSMINIQSHLTQKLSSFQNEKEKVRNKETVLEKELIDMRDYLFEEKAKYNKISERNEKLKHKFILLQHPIFIDDYKDLIAENKDAQAELKSLKEMYTNCMKIVHEKNVK